MNANELRLLVERLTKTVRFLEELLEQADTLLVQLERELEEMEDNSGRRGIRFETRGNQRRADKMSHVERLPQGEGFITRRRLRSVAAGLRPLDY